MKASEIIARLQQEIEVRGDLEVMLYGEYGAESSTFEVASEEDVGDDNFQDTIWIYTGLSTG